jgi:hypothetical protein
MAGASAAPNVFRIHFSAFGLDAKRTRKKLQTAFLRSHNFDFELKDNFVTSIAAARNRAVILDLWQVGS